MGGFGARARQVCLSFRRLLKQIEISDRRRSTIGGGIAGFVLGGPIGCAIGIATRGKIGDSINPDATG